MLPSRVRVTSHINNSPFGKGADGNDKVQRSRKRLHLPLVDLVVMTRVDNENAILEDKRAEITSIEDLLSSIIPGTYDYHRRQNGSHLELVQLPRMLSIGEEKSWHRDGTGCPQ